MDVKRGQAVDVSDERRALVESVVSMVKEDEEHWSYAFQRMREWRAFARGRQWGNEDKRAGSDINRKYVANVTLRHLTQRRDATYARNPRFVWKRTRRMLTTVWDGTAESLRMAQMTLASQTADMRAVMEAEAVVEDARQYHEKAALARKVGETLSILYEWNFREQTPPTKKMLKRMILNGLINGVAYVRQTFQRATALSPDAERAIRDHMARIAEIEQIASDIADGEDDPHSAEAERLRLMIREIEQKEQVILREGLAFDYPDPTHIIPDKNMTFLPGFVGCSRVSEKFVMSPKKIQQVYGVDVKGAYRKHGDNDMAHVYEVWVKSEGLVYTVCEGYHDFLVEPHAPEPETERFWPWFVFAPNVVDDDDDPFPVSDVELVMPMQVDINDAGQSLRTHRSAARPGHVVLGSLDVDELKKITTRSAHDVVPIKGAPPDTDIRRILQPIPTNPIDPNLYNTGPSFADLLRSVGTQEANLGGVSGGTATETSIAESNRQVTRSSIVDELDDMLSEMAKAGGQILLREMTPEKVREIVGPGAVWPELSAEDIEKEIFLEVVAGSSGRPNQGHEVQIRERLLPYILQIPGISPEQVAKDIVRVIDDSIQYEEWIDPNAPSIAAINGSAQAAANRGGIDNAERPPGRSASGPPGPGQTGMG